MLLFEEGVTLSQFGQLRELGHELGVELDLGVLAAQSSLAHLLAPSREHERMDVECFSDLLYLHA